MAWRRWAEAMAHGEDGDRASRARVRVGVFALVIGCSLVGDVTKRASAALSFGIQWWPWILLGLALVNLLRGALPSGSFIGPFLLAGVAMAGLTASGRVSSHVLTDIVVPILLAVGGALLLIGLADRGSRSSWSRMLTTGHVVVPRTNGRTITIRAVLGELRADLTRAPGDTPGVVHVTAVAGHVSVVVPRDRLILLHTSGTVLTRVVESGPRSTAPPDPSLGLTVHVLGICAVVGVVRV